MPRGTVGGGLDVEPGLEDQAPAERRAYRDEYGDHYGKHENRNTRMRARVVSVQAQPDVGGASVVTVGSIPCWTPLT